jgi:tetratricopeptide (TPR) repeat protein
VRKTFLRLVLIVAFASAPTARANQINLDKCADGRFMGLELAIDYCTRAIKSGKLSNRGVATAYYNRGLYHSRQGRHDLGLRDLTEAIRIEAIAPEPDDTRAMSYSARGSIHYARRNYDAALADYDEALRLDSRFGDAYLRRGQTWVAKREPDRALADFDRALKNDVPDATQFGGASSTYRQGRPRNFDRSSHDSACHLGRAFAFQIKNDPVAAMAAVDEAIRVDPRNYVAFRTRAAMHEQRADYAAAIADYSAALQQNPRDPAGYYSRGRAWAAQGEYASGARDFDEALRLEPRYHAARISRAFIAFGEGSYEQAADQIDSVLQQTQPRAYLVLWKHVARARSGSEKGAGGRDELARESARLAERSIHMQLVELYLGRGDECS